MYDKLDIHVYIISLDNKSSFNFNKYFKNVNIFQAVDARKKNPRDYYNDGIISQRVLIDLERGRKDHFAFSGIGGIGLILTYRKLLEQLKNVNHNVLICEDDCIIDNIKEFRRKVKLLENENFDCAIFGPLDTYKISKFKNSVNQQFNESNNIIKYNLPEKLKNDFFVPINYNYIGNHSIIWSPTGIKKAITYLNQLIEQQLDYIISFLSENNQLKLIIEKDITTSQKQHKSNLANDKECKLCEYDVSKEKYNKNIYYYIKKYVFLVLLVLIIIIMSYCIFKL